MSHEAPHEQRQSRWQDRHRGALGPSSCLVLPSMDLRGLVRCYLLRDAAGSLDPAGSWLPASASASFHFVLGGSSTYARSGQLRAYGPEAFVAGPSSHAVATRSTSPLSTVSVVLWPGSLHHFGPLDSSALADEFVPAHSAGLPGLGWLVERMAHAGPEAAVRALEDGLRALLRRHEGRRLSPSFHVADALRLVALLREEGPHASAAHAGLSLRQFQRRFQLQFGTTPKECQRLARFDRFLVLARTRGVVRGQLADLALELGYYDQSHLHNEFKRFAGFTPLALPRYASGSAPGAWVFRATGPAIRPF